MNDYINSKDNLETLEKEVLQGTESLEKSLVELKALAKEVQGNLEKVKNPGTVRNTVKEGSAEAVEKKKEEVLHNAEDTKSAEELDQVNNVSYL